MKFLSIDSDRFIVNDDYVGIDNRYWFRIVKHRSLFRGTYYTTEIIFKSSNIRDTKEKAINLAKRCIADFHDMIKREDG
jgi:hypothetical protein